MANDEIKKGTRRRKIGEELFKITIYHEGWSNTWRVLVLRAKKLVNPLEARVDKDGRTWFLFHSFQHPNKTRLDFEHIETQIREKLKGKTGKYER